MSDQNKNKYKDRTNEKKLKEIQWICKEHSIGNLQKIEGVIGKGKTNSLLLVKTNTGKYVLRYISIPITEERINYIEALIKKIKIASLPVISSIKTRNQYFSIVNNRIVQVYPYMKGLQFSFTKRQIKSNADILNKFHNTLKDCSNGPLPQICIYPTIDKLEKGLKNIELKKNVITTSEYENIKTLFRLIIKKHKKIGNVSLPLTIIHDDWHPWNLLYNVEGSIATILDYDYFQRGERIYDIAYAIYHLYMFSPSKSNEEANLFLKVYEELLPEEKIILPLIVAQVSLFFIFHSVEMMPENVKQYLRTNGDFINFLLSHEGENFLQFNKSF